jgi:hypothetical protein
MSQRRPGIAKPLQWAVDPGLIDPRYRRVWEGLGLRTCFWDGSPRAAYTGVYMPVGSIFGTSTTVDGPYGPAWETFATGDWATLIGDPLAHFPASDECTIAALHGFTGSAGNNYDALFYAGDNTGVQYKGLVNQGGPAGTPDMRCSLRVSGTTYQTASLSRYTGGVADRWYFGRWRSGEKLSLQRYLTDGTLEAESESASTISGTTDVPGAGAARTYIGRGAYSGDHIYGRWDVWLIIPTRLTDAEVAALIADPFGPWRMADRPRLFVSAGGGGTTLGLSPATETEAAQGLAAEKRLTVSLSTETDAAQAITAAKSLTVGSTAEADSAQPSVATKSAVLGPAASAEAALALTVEKTLPVATATETDTAVGIVASKAPALSAATETDAAAGLAVDKVLGLGIASEADAALPLSTTPSIALGVATETDTAIGATATKLVSVGVATEAGSALTLGVSKILAVGLASEADAALAVAWAHARTLTAAVETDGALTIAPHKLLGLGIAGETDTAFDLTPTAAISVPADGRIKASPRAWVVQAAPRTHRAKASPRSWRTSPEN